MTHPAHGRCGWGGDLTELEKGELPLSICQAAAEEAPHPPSHQLGPVVAGEWLICFVILILSQAMALSALVDISGPDQLHLGLPPTPAPMGPGTPFKLHPGPSVLV